MWQVIVFHGETISAWRKQGYHEDPEHQNFRELLNAPKEDAAVLLTVQPPQLPSCRLMPTSSRRPPLRTAVDVYMLHVLVLLCVPLGASWR